MLKDLYEGKLRPLEQGPDAQPEYRRLSARLRCLEARLRQELDETGKELLFELDELHGQLAHLVGCSAFTNGFCLGVQMMEEVRRNTAGVVHSSPPA